MDKKPHPLSPSAANVTKDAAHPSTQDATENDYNARTWKIERNTPIQKIRSQMKRLGIGQ